MVETDVDHHLAYAADLAGPRTCSQASTLTHAGHVGAVSHCFAGVPEELLLERNPSYRKPPMREVVLDHSIAFQREAKASFDEKYLLLKQTEFGSIGILVYDLSR